MKLFDFTIKDKMGKLILIMGVVAVAFIFLSTFIGNTKSANVVEPVKDAFDAQTYTATLEAQVTRLLESIAGVGKAQVMVTLQSGSENVYITEENLDLNQTKATGETTAERRSSEKKILLVEDSNGRRQALLKTTLEPTVRGVVVVCEGGDDPFVVAKATDVVKAALNLSSNRICVTKLAQ